MREWRIIVPHDVASLSPNARMHPGRRIRLVKEARTRARLCWMAAGSPVAGRPVVVSAIIRRGRRLADADNQVASLKPLLDGMFNNALTPNDSERFVRLGEVSQETGAPWRLRPEVEFIIREVDVEGEPDA